FIKKIFCLFRSQAGLLRDAPLFQPGFAVGFFFLDISRGHDNYGDKAAIDRRTEHKIPARTRCRAACKLFQGPAVFMAKQLALHRLLGQQKGQPLLSEKLPFVLSRYRDVKSQ
ncbi:MAG: hypothetical protein WCF40_12070, partial [Desulfobacterales bacterium]